MFPMLRSVRAVRWEYSHTQPGTARSPQFAHRHGHVGGDDGSGYIRQLRETNPLVLRAQSERHSNGNISDAQCLDTIEISIDRDIAEAALIFLRWLIKTTLCIGCHEQDDTYTRIAPGLNYRLRHRIGIIVGPSARLMMYIVKFTHASIASPQHLTIGSQSFFIQCVSVQVLR